MIAVWLAHRPRMLLKLARATVTLGALPVASTACHAVSLLFRCIALWLPGLAGGGRVGQACGRSVRSCAGRWQGTYVGALVAPCWPCTMNIWERLCCVTICNHVSGCMERLLNHHSAAQRFTISCSTYRDHCIIVQSLLYLRHKSLEVWLDGNQSSDC